MKRRQYGTGSVFQRKSDGRWMGTLEAGYTASGSRRRITVSAATQAEAKRRLRDRQREVEKDGADAATRTTVKAFGDAWLAHEKFNLRPKTVSAYQGSMKWIVATIGHRRLADLTTRDIRAVEMAQRDAGLSSTTALHTHAVLARMLRAALADGHAIKPQLLVAKRPKAATNDRETIPTADAVALLEVAFGLPHFSRWAAALFLGLRRGEALGLTWDEVDLERGVLAVSWQLQSLPYADRKAKTFAIPDGYEVRQLEGARHLVRPKTQKGWRLIPLVAPLGGVLEEWRLVAPHSPHGLVWPNAKGGPTDVKHDLDEWKALQGTAGIGHPSGRYYVLHEARNTTATLLMEANVPAEVITAVLGHSSISTSRAYMHVSTDQARKALESVAGALRLSNR